MSARARLYTSRWQGQFAVDFTLANLAQQCDQLTARLVAAKRSCLIAYDTRFMSGVFARELRRRMLAQGLEASLASAPASLPAVQHALLRGQADCALCVSAGNLPYWYNGLVLLSRYPDEALLPLLPAAPTADEIVPSLGDEQEAGLVDLRTPYLELLRGLVEVDTIRRATMTIFVDAMNGTSAGYLPAIIGESQTKAIEINREPDTLFGKLTPNPVENGLARLRKLVRESDSHVGVAISADGTALGAVDNTGAVVEGDLLVVLLASYLHSEHRMKGSLLMPESSRALISRYEQRLGLRVEYTADAEAALAAALAADRPTLLIGRSESGQIAVGRSPLGADGVYAALLLIEMIARSGGKLRTLIDEIDDQSS